MTNRNTSRLFAAATCCFVAAMPCLRAGAGDQPPSIVQQPQSLVCVSGDITTFSVEVSGGPVAYQWQKDQADILGATNANLTFAPVWIGNAGIYRVIVSNSFGSETSSNAVLTVMQELGPPVMLSAVATATNRIDVTFNEAVQTSIPTENLRVIRSGTSGPTARPVTVTSILVSARTVRIRLSENLDLSKCYYVQANDVADVLGVAIAADSVIGVVMPGSASACPVPSDPPLDQLRLSIHRDANGTRISWPPGYHGFALVSTYDYAGNGPVIWRPATNQSNGGLVPPGPNRVLQLRKYP